MAMSSRTLILGSLGLGVAAALAYVALRTDPVPVDLHRIERAALQVTVNADGTFTYEPDEDFSGDET